MPINVGVYVRISADTEGAGKGVGRQREDCADLAALRRWKVARVYEDNDFSAYKKAVVRPEFEQMLTDLRLGAISGIVVYNLDRLARQPKDLERVIDVFDDNPAFVFATLEGDINLATIDGRTMARVMVAFANKSSADTGRRVARKQLELAREGKPHGGRQAYGWGPDGLTADPEAKAEILAAHAKILGGCTIADIHRDWIERGIHPTDRSGKRFQNTSRLHYKTVQRVLSNPALAGIKRFKGEVVLDDRGEPVKGAWETICSPEQLTEVVEVLTKRMPGGGRAGGNAASRYLLSGIALCGLCSKPLRGQMRKRANGERYIAYACDTNPYVQGCGRVSRRADEVDRLVIKLVLAYQKKAQFKLTRSGWRPGQQERLDAILADLAELRAGYSAGKVSMTTLLDLVGPLERERDELALLKRRAERSQREKQVVEYTKDSFDALLLPRQRAVILQTLRAVVIHPQGRGKKFDPDLIEPLWA